MSGASYTNPVFQSYFADPFVWRAGGAYYAVGTGQDEAVGHVHADGVFPMLQSDDLVHWRSIGRALARPDEALGDAFWAPEVTFAEGRWWLYYSVGWGDRSHQLRAAVSEQPAGPYVDACALTQLEDCAFAIDPHPFKDDDGRWWLFHARDFLDDADPDDPTARCGTALVVHQLTQMTQLAREGHTVARAHHSWQRFAANRLMYGRVLDWHTLEGPSVVKHGDRYHCLYSGGCWRTDSYGVDYVSSDRVCGPYTDTGVASGPRVLRTVPEHVIGPGHCSVVNAEHGRMYLAYHAWDAELQARRMCIDRLWFTADGPRCNGPTWTEQVL